MNIRLDIFDFVSIIDWLKLFNIYVDLLDDFIQQKIFNLFIQIFDPVIFLKFFQILKDILTLKQRMELLNYFFIWH